MIRKLPLRARIVRTARRLLKWALVSLFLTLIGTQGAILRLFRLFRIVALAKLGRYSSALNAIGEAIRSRRYELTMSLAIAGLLLLVSSTLLYMIEGEGQPDDFGEAVVDDEQLQQYRCAAHHLDIDRQHDAGQAVAVDAADRDADAERDGQRHGCDRQDQRHGGRLE